MAGGLTGFFEEAFSLENREDSFKAIGATSDVLSRALAGVVRVNSEMARSRASVADARAIAFSRDEALRQDRRQSRVALGAQRAQRGPFRRERGVLPVVWNVRESA